MEFWNSLLENQNQNRNNIYEFIYNYFNICIKGKNFYKLTLRIPFLLCKILKF